MSKLGIWIITLVGIGLLLFSIVQFVVIPKQDAAAEQYIIDQQRPLTHDLDNIIKYKFPYMGNASISINLYQHLPLNDIEKDFELLSDNLAIKINYRRSVSEIGEGIVHQSIIYNSTAAFALIGNLEKLIYHFEDESFEIKRENIESLYQDFDQLITDKDIWNKKVRDPLKDDQYVKDCFDVVLNK